MSRFDTARRSRIVAWTGAALAWGTALTIAVLQPKTAEANVQAAPSQPSASSVVPTSQAALPTEPVRGLVILRFQPSTDDAPEVRTVYVQQQAPRASSQVPAQSVPAPRSSGS